MKAITLIPAVALLVSACASGPSGPTYGYGGPGYYGGSETVFVNDRDHGYDRGYDSRYNVSDVNVNRTNIDERTVNRTNVNESNVTRSKTSIAAAGKRTVTRKSGHGNDEYQTH